MLFKNYTENSVNLFLRQIKSKKHHEKLKFIIKNYIGNPYKVSPLNYEKNNYPSFDLYNLDCVTFVINSLSLAISETYNEFIDNYKKLMYKSNETNFKTRYHFSSDRIINNIFFKLIYPKVLKTDIINCSVILNKKSNNSKLIDIEFKQKTSLNYLNLNSDIVRNFLNNNKKIYCVSFLKTKNFKNGYIISHEGFLYKNKLIHASKDKHKVTEINIIDYLNYTKFDGIVLSDILLYSDNKL
jgi:hypothetical protein